MSQYFALFQIGPVQEFIQTARKTQDFWAGSFLLSYFCATGIKTITPPRVIFPFVNPKNNPLYNQVDVQKEAIPWQGTIPEEAYLPSIPNRLLCEFPEDQNPEEVLGNITCTIMKQWGKIHQAVFNNLPSHLKNNPIWLKIWNRQVKNPFEILYVWRKSDWPKTESYNQAYLGTEALMGIRKSNRWFDQMESEEGHKCSLCGIREVLHLTSATYYTRREVRNEWNSSVRTGSLSHKFRKGETLCSICLIKRLVPDLIFIKPRGIPSTSTVAVAKTVKDLVDNQSIMPAQKIKEFYEGCRDLAVVIKEPPESMPLNINNITIDDDFVLDVDGDWFYEDFYYKLKNEPDNKNDQETLNLINKVQETQSEILTQLKLVKKSNNQDYLSPCKYYGVLVGDADNMGKILANMQNIKHHKELSRILADFSVQEVAKILQSDQLGFLVYWGGDEGLALLTLEDLLSALKGLRQEWENKVINPLRSNNIPFPSLSVGVAIAHHQDGLRGVISSAREALKIAKELDGKDAFCVILHRRSSGMFVSKAKWEFYGVSVLDILNDFKEAYRKQYLSPSWINELRSEKALEDPPQSLSLTEQRSWEIEASKIRKFEIRRILTRHTTNNESAIMAVSDLIQKATTLNRALTDVLRVSGNPGINPQAFDHFLNLMDLAQYIAKGGGK